MKSIRVRDILKTLQLCAKMYTVSKQSIICVAVRTIVVKARQCVRSVAKITCAKNLQKLGVKYYFSVTILV